FRVRLTASPCNPIISSNTIPVTINALPVITDHPDDVTACLGGNANFSVGVTGGPYTYQWRRNGNNIPGATSSTFSLTGIDAGDAGNYDVVITNACGSTISNQATLTVGTALNPAGHDTNPVTACANYNPPPLTINSPSPSGGQPPYSYQCYLNGNPLGGETNNSYDPPSRAVGVYNYHAVVSDVCGKSVSASVKMITIVPDPTVAI